MVTDRLTPFSFYTVWALLLHSFYLFGMIPNTYYVSLFVFIGSQFLNYGPTQWVKKIDSIYYILYDIVAHILPFIILFIYRKGANIWILLISLYIYLLMNGDQVIETYFSPETPRILKGWIHNIFE